MAAHSPEKHSNGRDRVGGTPGHVRARASESSLASQWTKSGKAKGGQDVSGLVGYV